MPKAGWDLESIRGQSRGLGLDFVFSRQDKEAALRFEATQATDRRLDQVHVRRCEEIRG